MVAVEVMFCMDIKRKFEEQGVLVSRGILVSYPKRAGESVKLSLAGSLSRVARLSGYLVH